MAMAMASPLRADKAVAEPILERGDVTATAAAGARLSTENSDVAGYGSVRFGVANRVELLLPGAIKVAALQFDTGSALLLGLGVSRFSWTDDGRALPSVAGNVAVHLRLGAEAGLLAAFEISTEPLGPGRGSRPLYGRAGAALSIDFGPYLTVSTGVTYQTELLDAFEERDSRREAAHLGASRVSFGGVFQEPVGSRPVLAFHIGPAVDFVLDLRLDVDTDVRSSSTSVLGGFSITASPR